MLKSNHKKKFYAFYALLILGSSLCAVSAQAAEPFPLFDPQYAPKTPAVKAREMSQASKVPPAINSLDSALDLEGRVDLLSDSLEHDETGQIVTAKGNVVLTQAGRRIKANMMSYNLARDVVIASGDVVLTDERGDQYMADNFELSQRMKEGFVIGLTGLLNDGSRFTAARGEQNEGGQKLVMSEATYTPCEPCKNNPDKVMWQIKAGNVTHHKDEKRISYENARFELGGVPVVYIPYFSHPDGSVKRKSGFLTPRAGFDSSLGTTYEQNYYWDIAPNRDATIGLLATSNEAPAVLGEYRHRFNDASFKAEGSLTYSSRVDNVDGNIGEQGDQWRGHLFSESKWDINDKYRAGLDLEITSDDQYLREYNFTNEDVLENNLYLERFDDRDYALARLSAFQDIRTSDRRTDQPNVLPEIYARFLGEPGQTLGGRWSFEGSALGLHREGNDQDVTRATLGAGWQRRFIAGNGLVSSLSLNSRGDAYLVNDIDDSASGDDRAEEVRGFVRGHFKTAYPLQRDIKGKAQWLIEPTAALTASTNVSNTDNIPNEDSQDVFIDPLTLFKANRFSGYDRIEDRSHATYGLRSGLFGYGGYRGEIFLGQSLRLDDRGNDDNPFPEGSGLSEDKSDIVGQVSSTLGSNLSFDYRLQLDENDFSSKRHELDLFGRYGPFTTTAQYFYTAGLEGTDLSESREQLRTGVSYKINDEWSVFGSGQYDFASSDEGLRRASSGFTYEGQCLTFGMTGQRTFTSDTSGDSDTVILLRLGLKNLGEFETSSITIESDDDEEGVNDFDDTLDGAFGR